MKLYNIFLLILLLAPCASHADWIDKSDWSLLFVTSQQTVQYNEAATNAFDGDPGTHWLSEWSPSEKQVSHPQEIQIDLGKEYVVDALSYLPRQCTAAYCSNGRIKDYQVFVSRSPDQWGEPVSSGQWANDSNIKTTAFPAVTARYVRLVALSEVNGHHSYTSAAEIGVREFAVQKVPLGKDVKITFDPSPDKRVTGHNLYINDEPVDLGSEIVYTIDKQSLIRGQQYKMTATAYGQCRVCKEDAELSPCPHDPDKMCCKTEDSHLVDCESAHSNELNILVVDDVLEPVDKPVKPIIKKIEIGGNL